VVWRSRWLPAPQSYQTHHRWRPLRFYRSLLSPTFSPCRPRQCRRRPARQRARWRCRTATERPTRSADQLRRRRGQTQRTWSTNLSRVTESQTDSVIRRLYQNKNTTARYIQTSDCKAEFQTKSELWYNKAHKLSAVLIGNLLLQLLLLLLMTLFTMTVTVTVVIVITYPAAVRCVCDVHILLGNLAEGCPRTLAAAQWQRHRADASGTAAANCACDRSECG